MQDCYHFTVVVRHILQVEYDKVQQKYPSIKFSVSPNHWANLTTKIDFAKFVWNWVVEENMKDAEQEGKELSHEHTETTDRCVWLLDCW